MSNFLVDSMTWSYSRLTSFEDCKYRFYQHYMCGEEEKPMFFASYGSLMHELFRAFYLENTSKTELKMRFLSQYQKITRELRAPSYKIVTDYFQQGLNCIKSMKRPDGKIIEVENLHQFTFAGKPFIGFIDMVYEKSDGSGLAIVDHKSRGLKPRSKRKKPTQTDAELDRYLRQLYIYASAVAQQYGRWPTQLELNCYRTGTNIIEEFNRTAFVETVDWAANTIHAIGQESDWEPDMEFFKCKHICGINDVCEYYEML